MDVRVFEMLDEWVYRPIYSVSLHDSLSSESYVARQVQLFACLRPMNTVNEIQTLIHICPIDLKGTEVNKIDPS